MATNIATYVKNLGKSVAFSTMDRIKEHTEASSSFVETNQELFADIYTSVKDYKGTFKRMESTIRQSKIYEAAELGLAMSMESIKTGEFYSKKREDYITQKALGSVADFGGDDFGDFDMGDDDLGGLADFDFGDEDLDIGDGDRYLAQETDRSAAAAAGAISETIAASAKYTAQSQRIGTNMLYSQSIITNNTLNAGFGQLHSTMQDIANAQLEAMKVADSNNQAYYNRKLELDKDRNEMLARILEIQQNAYGVNKKDQKEKEDLSFRGITDASGQLDIKKYLKVIKNNLKNEAGMLGALGDMFGDDSNPFLTFAANPLQFIPNMIASYLLPKSIEQAMQSFDKTVSGFFGSALAKINSQRGSDNPIADMIGKIFGIRTTTKSTLDSGEYEKGTVPFDGITRKSIIEVIPFYLRQIAAAVTGQEEVIYDYKAGKFISAKSLTGKFKDLKNASVKSATSEIRSAVNKNLDNVHARFGSFEDQTKFFEDMEKLYEGVYNSGGYLNTKKNRADLAQEYGMSEDNLRFFLDSIWPNIDRGDRMNLAGNVLRARQSQDDTMRDLEAKGDSVYNWLFNDSDKFGVTKYTSEGIAKPGESKSILTATLDDKGRNLFYYLQQTVRELMWQRENWGRNVSGGVSGPSTYSQAKLRTHATGNGFTSFDDIAIPVLKTKEQQQLADSKARDRERFNSKLQEMMEKYPDGFDMSQASPDELAVYASLKSKMAIANQTDRRKEFADGKYEKIVAWYEGINPYGSGENAKGQWKDINDMVENTDGVVNQLKKAKTLKDKVAVLKINSAKGVNSITDFMLQTIGRADQALYSLVFGDDKEEKDGAPSFLDALTAKVESTFERVNAWIDDQLDELKQKLGIESFGDIPKKIAGYFGIDLDEKMKNAREKAGGFFKPIGEGIHKAINDAFDQVKDALDGVATDIGLNEYLDKRAVEKDRKKAEADRLAAESAMEEVLANAAAADARRNQNVNLASISRGGLNIDKINAALQGVQGRRTDKDGSRMWGVQYGSTMDYIERTLASDDPSTKGFKIHKGQLDFVNKKDSTNIIAQTLNHIPTKEEYDKYYDKNAFGTRYVEKAGLTAISEGELIIPANLNPFNPNRDKVRLEDQARNEQEIINAAKRGKIRKRAEGTGSIGRSAAGEGFLGAMWDVVTGAAGELKTGLFGKASQKDPDFERKLTEMKDEVSKHMPQIVGGGVVGGVLSLLTGMVGGPLLGAAAGAAINVTASSEAMKKVMFGEMLVDENGEPILDDDGKIQRKGGMISKEVQKYLPDLKKYGIVGTLAGFLTPLGPIGGLMAGSAIAYAKNNERISEALFGEAGDPDSGLFSQNRKKWIKDRLPNLAVGAAGAMLFGPFGLVGNALVGSGLGLLSTTDEFKDAMFGVPRMGPDGEEIRDGGIVGALREGIVDPLKEMAIEIKDKGLDWLENKIIMPVVKALDPIGTEIGILAKNMFDTVGNYLNGMFSKVLGKPLEIMLRDRVIDPISGFVKATVGRAIKPAGWLLSRPSAAIGAIGNRLRTKQVKRGQASYMTAAQRLQWREEQGLGSDEFSAQDQYLAGADSESLDSIINQIKAAQAKDITTLYRSEAGTISDTAYRAVDARFNKKDRDKIISIMKKARPRSNDIDKLDAFIRKVDYLTPAQQEEAIRTLKSEWVRLTDKLEQAHASAASAEALSGELLRKTGINIDFKNKRSVKNALDLFNKEKNARILSGMDKEAPVVEPTVEIKDTTKSILDVLKDAIPIWEAIRRGDTSDLDSDIIKKYNLNHFDKHVKHKKKNVAEEVASTTKQVHMTDQGPIAYEVDTKGDMAVADDQETQNTIKKIEEKDNVQKGILSRLTGIGSSLTGFFKNFFIGNKTTEQEPWWKELLKTVGIVAIGAGAAASIYNWLDGQFNISEKFGEAYNSAQEAVNDQGRTIGGVAAGAAARLYARGTGNFASAIENNKILSKVPGLKGTAKALDAVRDAGKKVIGKQADGSESLARKLANGIMKVFNFIGGKIPKATNNGIVKFCTELGKAIANTKAGKAYGKVYGAAGKVAVGAAKGAVKAVGALASGGLFIAADAMAGFISGYQEAGNIFGLVEGATDGEGNTVTIDDNKRIVAGIIRALNNIVTLGIIHESTIVNLALKYIAPLLGFDTSEIDQMRAISQNYVDAFNEGKEEQLSLIEYNMEYKDEKSIFKKIGDSAIVTSVKDVVTKGFIPAVKNVAGKAWDFASAIGPSIAELLGYTATVIGSSIRMITGGNEANDDKWTDATAIDPNDPLSPLKKVLFYGSRILMAPIVLPARVIFNIGKKAMELGAGFGNMIKGTIGDISNIMTTATTKSGSAVLDLWFNTEKSETETSGLFSGIRTTLGFITKVLMTPAAMVSQVSHSVSTVFGKWTTDLTESGAIPEEAAAMVDELMKGSSPIKNVKKFLAAAKIEENPNNPISGVMSAGSMIWKGFNVVGIAITNTFNLIKEKAGGIFDALTSAGSWIVEKVTGIKDYFTVEETTDEALKAADKAIEKEEAGKGKSAGGSAISRKYYQKDPRYANVAYMVPGDSRRQTIGDSGCGPVAGANLLSQITGYDRSVVDAAKFAVQHGYKAVDSGTDPKYFEAYLNAHNVNSEYYKDPTHIRRVLSQGRPIILMGKDGAANGSTPYGKHAHYVVATGIDRFGNIIIDDPESRQARRTYSANKVLSKTSLGVAGHMRHLTGPKGGAADRDYTAQDLGVWSDNITAEQIDAFLKTKKNGKSKFNGHGKDFIEAGKKSGLDPRYILAHACLETGYGTEGVFLKSNNCFGIAAYDSSPNSAYKFSSIRDGIIKGAKWIRKHYYDKGHKTLAQMKAAGYATDPQWPTIIASIMKSINAFCAENSSFTTASEGYTSSGGGLVSIDGGDTDFWSGLTKGLTKIGAALWGESFFGTVSGSSSGDGDTGSYGHIAAENPSGSADEFFAKYLPGYSRKSSEYGEQRKTGRHKGIDYAAKSGTDIVTPVNGTVTTNAMDKDGFGNYVVVTDDNGHKHYFAHMNSASRLTVGTKVERGDVVGKIGSTGRSTGPHLHYEIRGNNGQIDPNAYFSEQGLGKNVKLIDPKENYYEARKAANSKGGSEHDQLLLSLIKAIIEILSTIAGNTDKLSQIVELLTKVTGAEVDASMLKSSKDNSKAVAESLLKALSQSNNGRDVVIDSDNDARLTATSKYLIDSMRTIAAS